jgi:hypothetical protein
MKLVKRIACIIFVSVAIFGSNAVRASEDCMGQFGGCDCFIGCPYGDDCVEVSCYSWGGFCEEEWSDFCDDFEYACANYCGAMSYTTYCNGTGTFCEGICVCSID